VPFRSEATVVRWPDRYMHEEGQQMWDRVVAILGDLVGREAAPV